VAELLEVIVILVFDAAIDAAIDDSLALIANRQQVASRRDIPIGVAVRYLRVVDLIGLEGEIEPAAVI
jgi:hypothetical protein